jgi:hypothetical protein
MKIAVFGTLVVALAFAVIPAGAQQSPSSPAKASRIFGTISTASPGAIVVTGRDGKAVTVKTSAGTKILGSTTGTFAQIAIGDSIRVVADAAPDGTLTATAVQDVPKTLGLPARGRGGERQTPNGKTLVTGTVAQVRGGAVSIAGTDGSATTVAVPQTAKIERIATLASNSLAVGTRVLVQGTPNQDGSLNALIVMVAEPAAH